MRGAETAGGGKRTPSNRARMAKSGESHERNERSDPALPGRVLGLDYGRKRIGLAVTDELRLTARPAGILERKNRGDLIRKLRETAREYGAKLIVVGYPLNLDGTAGEMAEEAARFAARVRKELGVEVDLMDERLTSWAAGQTRAETGGGRRAKSRTSTTREENDDVAAAIVLRDYIESHPVKRAATRAEKD
jgi:putative Holliday junction resolvase